jgi:hypothetical protein
MSDVIISEGNLAGKGVYANRDFKKDEIVVQYHLKPLNKKEYEQLPEENLIQSVVPNRFSRLNHFGSLRQARIDD